MGQRRSLATVLTVAGTHTAVFTTRTCRSDASTRHVLLNRHRLAVVRLDGHEQHNVVLQVNSALHPSVVAKSSTSFGWGKGGKVTSHMACDFP